MGGGEKEKTMSRAILQPVTWFCLFIDTFAISQRCCRFTLFRFGGFAAVKLLAVEAMDRRGRAPWERTAGYLTKLPNVGKIVLP